MDTRPLRASFSPRGKHAHSSCRFAPSKTPCAHPHQRFPPFMVGPPYPLNPPTCAHIMRPATTHQNAGIPLLSVHPDRLRVRRLHACGVDFLTCMLPACMPRDRQGRGCMAARFMHTLHTLVSKGRDPAVSSRTSVAARRSRPTPAARRPMNKQAVPCCSTCQIDRIRLPKYVPVGSNQSNHWLC